MKILEGGGGGGGGGFELKNFSYTYKLFKGNYSMESKIIENMR